MQPSRPVDSETIQELVAISSVVEGLVLGPECHPPPASECPASGHVGAHFTAWLQSCSRRHTKCREEDSAGLFHQRALAAHLQSHEATAPGQAATSLERWEWLLVWGCSVGSCPSFCLSSPWAILLQKVRTGGS